jgi:SAM-dependent methyltransferase
MKLGMRLIPRQAKRFIKQALLKMVREEVATLGTLNSNTATGLQAKINDAEAGLKAKIQDLEIELQQVEGLLQAELSLLPLPPKHLQRRVAGDYHPAFVWAGPHTYGYLNKVLGIANKQLSDFSTILDFGCGCGRMIRAIRKRLPAQSLFGTDIDPEAIAWLREYYAAVGDFRVNPHLPPMTYEDNFFDFIFSISIFTHLPEDMQFAWLAELQRIAKPGGYLILTTHGERHFHLVEPEFQTRLKTHGFHYMKRDFVTTEGLPVFYQTAFHSPDYIRREWSKYFEVVAIEIGGQGGWQDMVLLRKRTTPHPKIR